MSENPIIHEEETKEKKDGIRRALFRVFLISFFVLLTVLISRITGQKQRENIYESLSNNVPVTTEAATEKTSQNETVTQPEDTKEAETETETETRTEVVSETMSAAPKEYLDAGEIPVDFETVHAVNTDAYAWIQVAGTPINYPILQNSDGDDAYYLDHTIEGAVGLPGSIYSQTYNSKDFDDPVTLIYGHNMGDNSMFGCLDWYKNLNFWTKYDKIVIYTEDGYTLHYRIFAGRVVDDRHLLFSFDTETKEGFEELLVYLTSGTQWSDKVKDIEDLCWGDHILILSTCNGTGNNGQRYVVAAVLTDLPEE